MEFINSITDMLGITDTKGTATQPKVDYTNYDPFAEEVDELPEMSGGATAHEIGGCQRGGARSRKCNTGGMRYRTDGWPMVSCVKYGELVQNKHTGHMGRLKVRNGRGIYIVDKTATGRTCGTRKGSKKGSRKGSRKGSKKGSRKGSRKGTRRSRSRSRSRSSSRSMGDEWKSLLALKWMKQAKRARLERQSGVSTGVSTDTGTSTPPPPPPPPAAPAAPTGRTALFESIRARGLGGGKRRRSRKQKK